MDAISYVFSGLTLIAVVILLCLFRAQKKSRNPKGKESSYAGIWWVAVFVLSSVLYFLAFINEPRADDQTVFGYYVIAVANAISTALKTFGFSFDYKLVMPIIMTTGFHGYFYGAAIVTCFIAACIWTISMAKNVFFKGIGNSLAVFLHAHKGWWQCFENIIPWKKATHYIVIGCEDKAILFLEDLQKTAKKKNITIITGVPTKGEPKDKYRSLIEDGYVVICGVADEFALRKAGIGNKKCNTIVVAVTESDAQNIDVAKALTCEVFQRVFMDKHYKKHAPKGSVQVVKAEKNETTSVFRGVFTDKPYNQYNAVELKVINSMVHTSFDDDASYCGFLSDIAEKKAQKDIVKAENKIEFIKGKFLTIMRLSGNYRFSYSSLMVKAIKDEKGNEALEFSCLLGKKQKLYKECISPCYDEKGRIVQTALQRLDTEFATAVAKVNIKAQIMYSFIERAEHFTFAENAFGKVDFFNPYALRIRDFFWKNPITSFIPNLIDTKLARLKGEFDGKKIFKPIAESNSAEKPKKEYVIKSVFIGFGATNFQMLKGSILTGQLLGVDYNAVVFDKNLADYNSETENIIDILKKNMSANQARFVNHSAGLFNGGDASDSSRTDYYPSPKEKINITFVRSDILSRAFYNALRAEVKDTDFSAIYVALGDDKFAIETAMEIRQFLRESGVDLQKIRIFVKIKSKSAMNDSIVINDVSNSDLQIETYGEEVAIFTHENVVCEEYDNFVRAITNKNHNTPWEFLPETERDSNRQVALASRTKMQLLGFDFMSNSEKNVINANEEYLVKYFGGVAGGKTEADIKAQAIFAIIDHATDKARKSEYLQRDEKNLISDTPRNNLARLEHLRWDTFYLSDGWTKLPYGEVTSSKRKDERTKRHACITDLDELVKLQEKQAGITFDEMRELEKLKDKDEKSNEKFMKAKIALGKADTIWYDFSLMDEIARAKQRKSGAPVSPRISDAPYSIVKAGTGRE